MIVVPVKIPAGNDIHEYLKALIELHGLMGGVIIGIGGLEEAEVGYLDPSSGKYVSKKLEKTDTILEVTSLTGNYLVRPDGAISIHIHVNISTPAGVVGGHLLKSKVYPFLELFLFETGASVRDTFDHR